MGLGSVVLTDLMIEDLKAHLPSPLQFQKMCSSLWDSHYQANSLGLSHFAAQDMSI